MPKTPSKKADAAKKADLAAFLRLAAEELEGDPEGSLDGEDYFVFLHEVGQRRDVKRAIVVTFADDPEQNLIRLARMIQYGEDPGKDGRPTISVDFDGVVHAYESKWIDAKTILDGPVPGAIEWLTEAVKRFNVAIFSTRNAEPGGSQAMREWFLKHGMPHEVMWKLRFPTMKPAAAILHIDDRGFQFQGTFPDLDEVAKFRPWNKKRPA